MRVLSRGWRDIAIRSCWNACSAGHCHPVVLERLLGWDEVQLWPGRIVGVMDYDATSRIPGDEALARECRIWNEGYPNWWLLSNVRRLPAPVPCRGNVGMWRLPLERANEVEKRLAGDAP